MAQLPKRVLDLCPPLEGLVLLNRGKVRDSYELPGHPDRMLVVVSNRVSIFDFVLNALVPQKGEILNAMSIFWTQVLGDMCETDLVAYGSSIDAYLPDSLKGNVDLQKRATVVKKMEKPLFEDIVRFVLTGSVLKQYEKTGMISGQKIPAGLKDGSLLPSPIYTPSTKAEEGHDINITADEAIKTVGFERERKVLQIAGMIFNYAAERGIVFADTKFEFSGFGSVLIDEKATPDSSRYFDKKSYDEASKKGGLPPSLDKQFVRNWGDKNGVKGKDPENEEHRTYVHSLEVPDEILKKTTILYRYIFSRLAGKKIESFQQSVMSIAVEAKKMNIHVLLGSESDAGQIVHGMEILTEAGHNARVHVISCHRNIDELEEFLRVNIAPDADVVIAGAGMAAALPGIVKAILCKIGSPDIPVIGVAFAGKTDEQNLAAKLSIKCLPEQPVELDKNGEAYFGQEGFAGACFSTIENEFMPKTVKAKPVQVDAKF